MEHNLKTPLPRKKKKAKKSRRRLNKALSSSLLVIGIAGCVLLSSVGVAAGGGVVAGQKERDIRATQTISADIDLQFLLGQADMEGRRYTLAAQRFHWIMDHQPDYPDIVVWISDAESRMNAPVGTAAATLPPSNTDNPAELFEEAKDYYNSGQWENAVVRLKELRAAFPDYEVVASGEMLHEALKSLGIDYLRGDRVEEGLFLLEQASAIKPLDEFAEGERHLATLYVTGKSYWRMNWPVVINNLQVIYDVLPNYRDGEVRELLWEARVLYGDQFASGGAACDASEQYQKALSMTANADVQEKYNQVESNCSGGTSGSTSTPTGTDATSDGSEATTTLTPTPDGSATATPDWNIP